MIYKNQEDFANMMLAKQTQYYCKNSDLKIVTKEGEEDKTEITLDIQNDGCKNPRRSGSAYCQECSDKHKQDGK
jgi:hypothetical protein